MKLISKIINRTKRFFRDFYKIPYCVPAWGWGEHLAILRCIVTGRIIKGNDKNKLFDSVKIKTEKPFVFGYNSGREAILAALKTRIKGIEDKVIMPSYCCETVAQAVISSGGSIVFCDIGYDFNPDVEHILSLIDDNVRAIIFPHMFGNPGRIDLLEDALVEKKLRSEILLIDDAAQSFGARLNGKLVGTFGDAGIISFGPGKTMTATGGGLLITENADIADQLENVDTHYFYMGKKLKKVFYWVVFRRWRKYTLPFLPFFQFLLKNMQGNSDTVYYICNIDAAVGIKQFKRLDMYIDIRIDRKKKLDGLMNSLPENIITVLPQNNQIDIVLNVATKYPFLVLASSVGEEIQNRYKNFLADKKIEMQNLYSPIHLSNRSLMTSKRNELSKTEELWNKVLHVPVEPSFSDSAFDSVFIAVEDFVFTMMDKNNATS